MTRAHLAGLCLLVACAPGRERSDSAGALAAVDTLKPATVVAAPDTTAARADSTKRASTPATKTKSTATATKTKTPAATTRDTAHLGRDSVIMSNPRDPRRQIPTVPPKKPPQ